MVVRGGNALELGTHVKNAIAYWGNNNNNNNCNNNNNDNNMVTTTEIC